MNKAINSVRLAAFQWLLQANIWFPGKDALLFWLCPFGGVATIDLFGHKLVCDLSSHMQRRLFIYKHAYDYQAEQIVRKNLKEGDVFIDVGANVGYYTLLASSIVGEKGKVVALEPNPGIFTRLKKTIDDNDIKNVVALNIGLGKEQGLSNLYLESHGSKNATSDNATMVPHRRARVVEVAISTLDLVAEEHQLKKIDYLKIDVEGFEPEVLAGAQLTLAKGSIEFIQCEFNEYWLTRNNSSCEALYNKLVNAGFKDIRDEDPRFDEIGVQDLFFSLRKDSR